MLAVKTTRRFCYRRTETSRQAPRSRTTSRVRGRNLLWPTIATSRRVPATAAVCQAIRRHASRPRPGRKIARASFGCTRRGFACRPLRTVGAVDRLTPVWFRSKNRVYCEAAHTCSEIDKIFVVLPQGCIRSIRTVEGDKPVDREHAEGRLRAVVRGRLRRERERLLVPRSAAMVSTSEALSFVLNS